MSLKNISNNPDLERSLREIAKAKTTQHIIPGQSYIPVTGKVLDEEDILLRVICQSGGILRIDLA
jgi:CDP-6-deoxy-D-xylo-4-hexulose-3-dehydrase